MFVIDEVLMVNVDFMDVIDWTFCEVRGYCSEFFGGV